MPLSASLRWASSFTLAQTWGLFMTTWVFQIFWQVLVILLIILFQSEIRQVLEKVDPLQAFGLRKKIKPGEWVQGFSEGAFTIGRKENRRPPDH
jgi:diadenylate cyclase